MPVREDGCDPLPVRKFKAPAPTLPSKKNIWTLLRARRISTESTLTQKPCRSRKWQESLRLCGVRLSPTRQFLRAAPLPRAVLAGSESTPAHHQYRTFGVAHHMSGIRSQQIGL